MSLTVLLWPALLVSAWLAAVIGGLFFFVVVILMVLVIAWVSTR